MGKLNGKCNYANNLKWMASGGKNEKAVFQNVTKSSKMIKSWEEKQRKSAPICCFIPHVLTTASQAKPNHRIRNPVLIFHCLCRVHSSRSHSQNPPLGVTPRRSDLEMPTCGKAELQREKLRLRISVKKCGQQCLHPVMMSF